MVSKLPPDRTDKTNFSSSSLGADKSAVSPEKSSTENVALDQLKGIPHQEAGRDSAPLKSKSITPPSTSTWSSIKTFFNRRFSTITEPEKKQAQGINLLIGKIEQDVERMSNLARAVATKERKFDPFPDKQSVEVSSDYLIECDNTLTDARKNLQELKAQESTALQLAEKHSTFDTLPQQIKSLEKSVQYLEVRIAILEKLVDLEITMKNYRSEESWDQFVVTGDKKVELINILKDCLKSPALKDDPEIQKYLAKQEKWSGADAHELITSQFPGLKKQFERLFHASNIMQTKRITNLDKKIEILKPLFAQYHSYSQSINKLENSIHNESLLGRIYRAFHSSESLEKKVKKLKSEQKEIYQQISKNGTFNPAELDWLAELGKTNPENMKLRKDLEAVSQTLTQLKGRYNISVRMTNLQKNLELYQQVRNKPEFPDLLELQTTIKMGIQELSENVQNWHVQSSELPKNFTKMDVLNQLKALLSVSFPTLQYRNERIFQLINKLGLHTELNQVILDRDIKIPKPLLGTIPTTPKTTQQIPPPFKGEARANTPPPIPPPPSPVKEEARVGDETSPAPVSPPPAEKEASVADETPPAPISPPPAEKEDSVADETPPASSLPPSPVQEEAGVPPLAPTFDAPQSPITPSDLLSELQPPPKVDDPFSQIKNGVKLKTPTVTPKEEDVDKPFLSKIKEQDFSLRHVDIKQIEKDKLKVKPVDRLIAEIDAENLKIGQDDKVVLVKEDPTKLARLQKDFDELDTQERLRVKVHIREKDLTPEEEDSNSSEENWT